jgi:hypothetical protein
MTEISFVIGIHRYQLASQVTGTLRLMLLHENDFGLNLYGYICHVNRGVGTRGDTRQCSVVGFRICDRDLSIVDVIVVAVSRLHISGL